MRKQGLSPEHKALWSSALAATTTVIKAKREGWPAEDYATAVSAERAAWDRFRECVKKEKEHE